LTRRGGTRENESYLKLRGDFFGGVMGEPFLGEIKIVSFNFPPKGWALCNGQQLPINQNQALFSLFGTTYGGNGRTTFGLPNLQGRAPIHVGSGFVQGQIGGETAHTITIPEMTQHFHFFQVSQANANTPVPGGNTFGASNNAYAAASNLTTIHPGTVTNTGGSQPHNNMQPYLVVNYIVALQGIFPSRN
jgi:microcystin-dependent protein